MIEKTDERIISLMVEKIERLISIINKYSVEDIQNEFVLSDSIQFEFEKLYEDSVRLSPQLRITEPTLPINELRSIRNRVAHNYESVSIKILIDTINTDLPMLRDLLINILKK